MSANHTIEPMSVEVIASVEPKSITMSLCVPLLPNRLTRVSLKLLKSIRP